MYSYRTRMGKVAILATDAGWQATFNGVPIGTYGSPEDAAAAMSASVGFHGTMHDLFMMLRVPADLHYWSKR